MKKKETDDTVAVMKEYGLPRAFPLAVVAEARKVSAGGVSADDFKGRLDLRRKFVFTCDPETARDYDDALSLETDRKGNKVLGVHIADVSHYVKPGSALDREAYRRGTSVYLCDRVVPMLPESLSNGACSLVPGEDRLAFSVFLSFDDEGRQVKRSFAKSVIRSKARYTYGEVMDVISGGGASMDRRERKTIREIAAIAQRLRAERFAAGGLDIEVPEAELVLDGAGRLKEVVSRPYDESHQMIEECMVAANEAVAKELWTHGIKILSRLHEAPDPEKMLALRAELKGIGVKVGNFENPKVFARFLKSIKSNPLYPTISTMVLRSMKKAVYDSTSIGHFGLAKKYYAHFTSPIRRYPDLTLHRQLEAYLAKKNAKVAPGLLARWAEHSSERETVATEAERALAEIKKFKFLKEQIESRRTLDYDAVVSRVMPFGCFVEIPDLAVSGLVHVSLLSRSYLRYNESDCTLSAPGGVSWRAGDALKVRIAHVDMDGRKLDFVPVFEDSREKRRKKAR